MLNQQLHEFCDDHTLRNLLVIGNIVEDNRERILLVKNRINSIRTAYLKLSHTDLNYQCVKNVIFHIRTVEKQCHGLSPEIGWL